MHSLSDEFAFEYADEGDDQNNAVHEELEAGSIGSTDRSPSVRLSPDWRVDDSHTALLFFR